MIEKILPLPKAQHYVIITDENVRQHFGEELLAEMRSNGCETYLLSFQPGEASKTQATKTMLEEQMLSMGCKKSTLIIALGGGVVGDLAGFIAATYMRGIPFIQVPTTLLAMIDSSVGGKTGINTAHGKNLIGAVWLPEKTVLDLDFLETLPDEQMLGGLFEAVKIFLTHDAESFAFVQKNMDHILAKDRDLLEELIRRAILIKTSVVERDLRSENERKVLNFGHTVGHALEQLSDYKMLHGKAVALGILVESKMAQLAGALSESEFTEIESTIGKMGVSVDKLKQFQANELEEAMQVDKKSPSELAKFVVLEKIGKVKPNDDQFVHDLELEQMHEAYNSLCQ